MKNLEKQITENKLIYSIFGLKKAIENLENISGISLPDNFKDLPESEQERRLKLAWQAGKEEVKPQAPNMTGKEYNSLDKLFTDAKLNGHQITGMEILKRRASIANNYIDLLTTDKVREEVIAKIVETAGGHQKTKNRMYSVLRYGSPKHWALDRFLLVKYGDSPARLSYCAGQDMSWEMTNFRNDLKK